LKLALQEINEYFLDAHKKVANLVKTSPKTFVTPEKMDAHNLAQQLAQYSMDGPGMKISVGSTLRNFQQLGIGSHYHHRYRDDRYCRHANMC